MPFHYARKKVRCLDAAGKTVDPAQPNAIRFEKFIFDLLPLAKNALVVEVDAAEAFCAVKNPDEDATDNPRLAKAAMIEQARRRLRAAGIQIAENVAVEINPLWASALEEIQQRLPTAITIRVPTYFN